MPACKWKYCNHPALKEGEAHPDHELMTKGKHPKFPLGVQVRMRADGGGYDLYPKRKRSDPDELPSRFKEAET